ncbi:MAG TPA: putative glycolipid-binding domain-containing protein [Nitriliruptorales bacterium]|nr:putative glycolipid-binding domain-containing protein [Nitriliruptorales bacterium]
MEGRLATVLWRDRLSGALERCVLERVDSGFRLAGTALLAADGVPVEVRYAVLTDARWFTREVAVRVVDADGLLLAMEGGSWWRDRASVPQLDGCVDVDLGFTPATNTLPINRLDLAVGGERELTAAWLQAPSLELRPLHQRYERLDERTYRYRSGDFTARLEVDHLGLVRDYEGHWELVAERYAAP